MLEHGAERQSLPLWRLNSSSSSSSLPAFLSSGLASVADSDTPGGCQLGRVPAPWPRQRRNRETREGWMGEEGWSDGGRKEPRELVKFLLSSAAPTLTGDISLPSPRVLRQRCRRHQPQPGGRSGPPGRRCSDNNVKNVYLQ